MLKFLCLVLFIAGSIAAQSDPDLPLKTSSASDDRILGGKNAKPGQFPYQAVLRNGTAHFCGGSIIGSRFILTAAQCTQGNNSKLSYITAIVGGSNIISVRNVYHKLDRIVNHPKFNQRTLANDISVLRTVKTIKFNHYTQPIPLPTTDVPVEGNVPATVTGYGQYRMGVSC